MKNGREELAPLKQFDIAIAGAGPAGEWAAARLATDGAHVALIDGSHPREKPCGGGVTGRALALLGASVEGLSEGVPIESASFAYRGRLQTMDFADRVEKLDVRGSAGTAAKETKQEGA